ncbi:MAG: bifunctional nicotinamidase/pyrazinamidase [Melioribacteraceae bacterium]|nr:bifunctional nicotinamidase/pyrazinamidase [Melioribacteraceae bacterium]
MKALLIVDVQNDFFPGGRMAVKNSEHIIPIINNLQNKFKYVFFSKEWRPNEHAYFASNNKLCIIFDSIYIDGQYKTMWPDHCIQLTRGAEFHKDINRHRHSVVITKGTDANIDSYSAFYDDAKKIDTGLLKELKDRNVFDLYICGLSTDRCVKYSAIDSVEAGFNTYVIIDATAPFGSNPDIMDKVIAEFVDHGVKILRANEV